MAERHKEHLGQSDVGVIMYRELLLEQIERVESGLDPIEVYRDPAKNQIIMLPQEESPYGHTPTSHDRLFTEQERNRNHLRYDPSYEELEAMFREAKAAEAQGAISPPPELPVLPVGVQLHRSVRIMQ